jgi:hypothetical protein
MLRNNPMWRWLHEDEELDSRWYDMREGPAVRRSDGEQI